MYAGTAFGLALTSSLLFHLNSQSMFHFQFTVLIIVTEYSRFEEGWRDHAGDEVAK
jgi:hypothetical protein